MIQVDDAAIAEAVAQRLVANPAFIEAVVKRVESMMRYHTMHTEVVTRAVEAIVKANAHQYQNTISHALKPAIAKLVAGELGRQVSIVANKLAAKLLSEE